MRLEQEWESFVLRLKSEAATSTKHGRRGRYAHVTAYSIVDYYGKPMIWVVPNGSQVSGVQDNTDLRWPNVIDFVRVEAREVLNKSRHGLCIVGLKLVLTKDGAVVDCEIGRGLRIEPSNIARDVLNRIVQP